MGSPVPVLADRHGDGLLQADLADVGHDLLELLLAPSAGIEHRDLVDWDHLYFRFLLPIHAATSIFLRLAIVAK